MVKKSIDRARDLIPALVEGFKRAPANFLSEEGEVDARWRSSDKRYVLDLTVGAQDVYASTYDFDDDLEVERTIPYSADLGAAEQILEFSQRMIEA